MINNIKAKEVARVEKELIKKIASFRPGKMMVKRKINLFPFLGMVAGFIFGVGWLSYFWDEVSGFVPQHTYRFGAIGVLGFPIVTTLIGILLGKTTELLVRKLR